MPLSLSRLSPTRLAVVVLAGLLAAGLLSSSALAATAADPGGRVGGLVLDSSNHPLAGATISLTDSSGAVAGSAHTDDRGRWSVPVAQGDYDLAVADGPDGANVPAQVRGYAVGADTKLNLILAQSPRQPQAVASSAGTSSTLTRSAAAASVSSGTVTFSGQVLDADGHPVGISTEITLSQAGTYSEPHDLSVAADGSFSMAIPAGVYTLDVDTGVPVDDCPGCAPEFTPQVEHNYVVENFDLNVDRHQTLQLARPASLPVTVVDPADQPVAGADVWTEFNNSPQPAVPDLLFPGALTKVYTSDQEITGPDGKVSLEFIPGSPPPSISVEPPPGTYLPSLSPFPSQTTGMTIQLQRGPTLHGRLVTASGDRLEFTEGYLQDAAGHAYPVASTDEGYAVTAPAGQYRLSLEVAHNEEGESSDYVTWSVQSQPFKLTGDQTVDLTVPLGSAHLSAVDDHGQPLEVDIPYQTLSRTVTIGDGIDATAATEPEPAGYDNTDLPVIGPSIASDIFVNGTYFPDGAYVAPGEDTIIVLMPGTGDSNPPTATTTTTTEPTTTTTTGAPGTVTSNDPGGANSHQPGTSTTSGYWALGSDGHVYNFGGAPVLGNGAAGVVDLEPTPTGKGYWILNRNGTVQAFGDGTPLGDVDMSKLAKSEEPASLSATPSGRGYWVFTNRGRVIAFGDAPFLGDMSGTKLNGPVLGSVATPTGKGYYMVASDGGIFAFGDATFAGSMGGKTLNAPVQSLVPDGDGHGYWLVGSDGGIFAFDAPFRGSMGATRLNKPVVGMVRYGDGYLMVGADGGIFNFSTSPFAGSLGDKPPASPVVAVAAVPFWAS